jgi:hypothetical protein
MYGGTIFLIFYLYFLYFYTFPYFIVLLPYSHQNFLLQYIEQFSSPALKANVFLVKEGTVYFEYKVITSDRSIQGFFFSNEIFKNYKIIA